MTDRTVTIADAAELTGLSRKALTGRVERGTLPATVEGGVRRIPVAALYRAGLLKEEPQEPNEVDRMLNRLERLAGALPELVAQLRAEVATERGQR